MPLVIASPDGEYRHEDEDCAGRDSGSWPALRMSESAADSRGLPPCPDCAAGEPEPGFGLSMSLDDFSAGERVAARSCAQWFAGVVERRYVRPEEGVDRRLVCEADQGYGFTIETLPSGRTRLEKHDAGPTANVLELARSKQ